MKLSKKKNGKGYLSGFLASISLSEARAAGLVGDGDEPLELTKVVEDGRIVIELKKTNLPD